MPPPEHPEITTNRSTCADYRGARSTALTSCRARPGRSRCRSCSRAACGRGGSPARAASRRRAARGRRPEGGRRCRRRPGRSGPAPGGWPVMRPSDVICRSRPTCCVGQGKRRREVRDDVGVVDVAGGTRAESGVEGGRERAIADPGRSERAHAGGRREAVGGQGGERRAEAVAAEPDRARPRQRRQLLDERRPDPLEGVPEPCMDRAVRRVHQREAGVVERIHEPIRLRAAEGDDDGARHGGDVRLRVAALDDLRASRPAAAKRCRAGPGSQ